MLLISTGLMMRSFAALMKVDPGLDPSGVIAVDIALPSSQQSRYSEDESRSAFYQQLIERLESVPGVERAGAVTTLPLSGAEESTAVYIEGREPSPDERHLAPNAHYVMVTPGYFETLGIPIKQGRDFTGQDKSDGLRVIIINEAFARRYWPDDDPIGKRIRVGFEREPRVIVGIVGNVKQTTLSAEPHYATYMPQTQVYRYGMTVLIRTREDALGAVAALRREVAALDKDLPVGEVRTMEEVVSASMAQTRFSALLSGLFAAVALILAAAGIYAVVSYYATQRRHEIGIRMALGAEAGDVLRLVIGHGLKLTFIGVALGFAAAFTLTRLMASLLFGVSATDPATFALTPLMLIAIALLACYIPGRRATRLDPMIALRYE
jgi:putative ABC transport system permease protein